ncbi:MAG TPA: DinB family protein [Chthoniobacterales bacterium]
MNALLESAREVLAQGSALLLALDDVAYATRLPAAFNASIGGHVRHCLDHFRSVLDGLDADEINYDARTRDPRIENVRIAALAATRRQLREIESLDAAVLDRPIRVRAKVSYAAGESSTAESTVGREIMFGIVHAIHHYALVGVMAQMLGATLPDGFGVAPSTIKHEQERLAA